MSEFPGDGAWVAVSDEESYNPANEYDSREEAIAEAVEDLSLDPGQTFWTGQVSYTDLVPFLSCLFNAERLFEEAQDRLYDVAHESAEFCDDVPLDQQEELEAALLETFMKWLDKHARGSRYWHLDALREHQAPGGD